MVRTQRGLTNIKMRECKCGKLFIDKTHSTKYCSNECIKNFSRNWGRIRLDFWKDNPHLCNICGCDNSGSKFRGCLECRMKYRIYNKKYLEKKKNE